MKNNDINKALLMFISLSAQAEEWAYALKGRVDQSFSMKVNSFLVSAKSLRSFCGKFLDHDILCEEAEIFSEVVEYISNATDEEKDALRLFIQSKNIAA